MRQKVTTSLSPPLVTPCHQRQPAADHDSVGHIVAVEGVASDKAGVLGEDLCRKGKGQHGLVKAHRKEVERLAVESYGLKDFH